MAVAPLASEISAEDLDPDHIRHALQVAYAIIERTGCDPVEAIGAAMEQVAKWQEEEKRPDEPTQTPP